MPRKGPSIYNPNPLVFFVLILARRYTIKIDGKLCQLREEYVVVDENG